MKPLLVNNERLLKALVTRLFSTRRKLPILVVSQTAEKTGPVIPLPRLQEAVGPLAAVYGLSGAMLKHFNRHLDHIFGIEPTGVRMYLPDMIRSDRPSRHPVWNQRRVEKIGTDEFVQLVCDLCVDKRILSPAEADEMSRQAPKDFTNPKKHSVPKPKRKVLSAKIPKPSEEQISALVARFEK
jgi:hypothetical protein